MPKQSIRNVVLILISVALSGSLGAQTAQPPKIEFPAASPSSTVKQRVGLTDIEVNYSRPSVKGRLVFGGLAPYGKVWRTGANSATKIIFNTAVKLNGTDIPAGTYELFTIPGPQEWTVIIHKNVSEWGAYSYDQKDDVARVIAKPVALADPVETFTIDMNDLRDDSATLNLIWEKTRVPVKIEVDVTSKLTPQIEAVMAGEGDGKKPYAQAALYYLDHNLDLKKAAVWMDAAIAAQPDGFYYMYHKARILAKVGDKEGAISMAKKSIEVATKAGGPAKDEYVRLNETLLATLK
jgi:hypothetical protein